MPNIKSAKKRVLVNEKKNADNRTQSTIVKNAIKKINALIDLNQIEDAEKMLPELYSALDKAVIKGVLHKNAAANKKSGIAKHIADVKSGKREVVIKKDNKTIAAEKAKAAKEAREAAKAEIKAKKIAAEEAKKATEEATKKPATKKATTSTAKKATAKKAEGEDKPVAKKTTAKKTTAKKAEEVAEEKAE